MRAQSCLLVVRRSRKYTVVVEVQFIEDQRSGLLAGVFWIRQQLWRFRPMLRPTLDAQTFWRSPCAESAVRLI